MSDPDVAKIVNVTFNRWSNTETCEDFLPAAKFYHSILPKVMDRISYIKKSVKKANKENDDAIIASNMEISLREKRYYDNLLAQVS